MTFYFAIIGTKDNPIYETEFGTSKQGGDGHARFPDEQRPMNQFILHSALDIVEEVQWVQKELYLKTVDRFNNLLVSCFLTAGNIKFLLLHDSKAEDPIRQFFADVHEAYVKTLMNPFYEVDMRITSTVFDSKVRAAAKKYL
ncbi:Sedlin [Pyronema domesticum]|uniref:Trafficking protein particle complex subunit n=1 Tax=Pyronema omphalodes (strain CBS 100304) TaxID=1076935 RepID=U4LEV9_PYROM|nr:Sedlin [Pyronema domesticum]CCX30393.1 Similar to Trafficking protein particle complex subunit 2; acc. no. Q08CN0 [Pyronema omphalodes CBS 100304]